MDDPDLTLSILAQRAPVRFPPLAFVDIETTGGTASVDRITEIGIVLVDEEGEQSWSSLVNPGRRIPPPIRALTGISDQMVAGAPTFAELAGDIASRLQGRVFVAHNARFDYGFIKNEFARLGADFRATVLCTVRLSRKLFPHYGRHGLDALIERHRLQVAQRHRALGDAQAIAQFWSVLPRHVDTPSLREAFDALTALPSLPSSLDPGLPAQLPASPGVYLFYGDNDLPLYIGKAVNLRQRVLSHFSSDHRSHKEMTLSQQVRRVEWRHTSTERGALLEEARLVKALMPIHNRLLRRTDGSFTWRLDDDLADGSLSLVNLGNTELGEDAHFGLFKSRADALSFMRAMADAEGFCLSTLGIEKGRPGAPCFSRQVRRCRGACVGEESGASHHARLREALGAHRLAHWPFKGAVAIPEGRRYLVIDAWHFLGLADSLDEARALARGTRPRFDRDTYRLLHGQDDDWQAHAIPLLEQL